ncbi:MAG TPA: type IV secretory system conjugative DNA transfer family protein [Verrucomicrobiae bacterium]|nr:type IV secretory system conjugative DNA transfer family protein [Verrucomicrobiae bacterium]
MTAGGGASGGDRNPALPVAVGLAGLSYGSLLVWLAAGMSDGVRFSRYSAAILPDLLLGHGPQTLGSARHPGSVALFSVLLAVLGVGSSVIAVAAGRWWQRLRRPVRSGVLGRADHARLADLSHLRADWRPAVRSAVAATLRWSRSRRPPAGTAPTSCATSARRHRATRPRFRLGTHHGRALWSALDDHVLVLGPTGAGKSSGYAVPAVLEWPGAVVVTDPKGELVARTLAYRQRMGPAAVFAPMLAPTDRWNPLGAILTADDALRTAGLLMGRPPERDPFWHDLARQLLHGLLVEAAVAALSLGDVLHLLQETPADELGDVVAHPAARRIVQGALAGGDRTAMGVVATCIAQLGPYGADQVLAATGTSDFDPADIATGGLRTLYCVVTPHDALLIRGLVGALLSRAWRACFAQPPRPAAAFVLDEFAQLTHLPELPALTQLGRSQGVRLCLLAQDLASVRATYGPEVVAALWSNCRAKVLLAGISEVDLLEQASRLAGTTTFHARAGGEGVGQPQAAQPLLHPDDIRRLRPSEALLLHSSAQPAIVRQRRWYRDRQLRAAVGLPVPARAHLGPAVGTPLCAPEPEPVALEVTAAVPS